MVSPRISVLHCSAEVKVVALYHALKGWGKSQLRQLSPGNAAAKRCGIERKR